MKSISISSIAIQRHIGTLMVALAAIVVGVVFIFRLQVDLLPAITYPRIGLSLDVPGVSTAVVVEEVTKPLEDILSATEGIEQIFSRTREGSVRIDLYFQPGEDIDRALADATAIFNRNRDRVLPDGVENASLYKFSPSEEPFYEFAVESASLDNLELRIFAEEEIGRELNIIPGVASVEVSGGLTEEIGIDVDLQRLQALGIGFNTVEEALAQGDRDLAGGRLQGETGEPLVRTTGRWQSVAEIRNLRLNLANEAGASRLVYLEDVARITDGTAEQRVFVSLNGKPAIKVSVQKQPEANTISVTQAIKTKLANMQAVGTIPADMQLITTKNEAIFIRNSIANLITAGLIGTVLAAIAVLLFLGSLRQTFIIATAIPLAILTAIILMKLFGLSINIFSLGGLALGVGIVVDNSIVMLENIVLTVRKRGRDNRNYLTNSIAASQEVESALVASTATNLVAVVPFLLIGGLFSLLFQELILTISFAIAASLLLALTVVPMLASRLLGIKRSSKIAKFPFLVWFDRAFTRATESYRNILTRVIRHRLIVIILAFAIFGGSSYAMLQQLPQEILPSIDTGQARLYASFPPGTNLETNRRVMQAVDEILLNQPETEYAFTAAGGFLFGSSTIDNPLRSSGTITLKPNSDVEAYVERVENQFQQLNLVDTRLVVFPESVRGLTLDNSPVDEDIDLILQGANLDLLEQTGNEVLEMLDNRATKARYRTRNDPRPLEVQIIPDPARLADLGLTVTDLGTTVQTAISGTVATQLQRGDRLVDVRVRLNESSRQSITELEQLPILTNRGGTINLQDVASITLAEAPGEVQRLAQRNVFIIVGEFNEEAVFSEAMAELQSIMAEIELPDGINILPSYAANSSQEVQNSLKILGGLAVFLVFVVMAVQYNSLIDPLIILFTVPLALAGGILGLYITDTAVGATVLVGAVLLVGIVVNNAIVMVELANQLRQEQCDKPNGQGYTPGCASLRATAIISAATARLRPILMTTITTVLGMFPLALGIGEGAELLQPLGVVVFSGLALATLLTLFIVPCFYVLLHGK
ncbi:efflux RND transporter permease subunit [Myxosarcina sp. GI1]|uniref:efflux RND transporter permease subunit n=1 Tax=Myxosarcina sp. GI1 TaxID=1541065 RepID=UPI00056648BD|nr:efflux RND transporter permease subunit [Myxosarcina sp. GI1]